MQFIIQLVGWSSLSGFPLIWPSSNLGLDLVSQKTLTYTFTGRVDFPKDPSFFNHHKYDTTKSHGYDKLVRCGYVSLTSENKYDQIEILNIGSMVGFKPTTLDDWIEILDIGSMVGLEPITTQIKSGLSPGWAKQQFNMG